MIVKNIPAVFINAPEHKVKRGDVLLRNGDIGDSVYYVIKGCLRSYIIDKSGKEHILMFAPEDWVIGDQGAFLMDEPAIFNIDALEDSIVRVLKLPEGNKLLNLDRDALLELSKKYQKRIISLQSRIIQLLSTTAEERYTIFNSTYPELSQRVPLKMIASYLGITPEGLSRVRKQLSNKK